MAQRPLVLWSVLLAVVGCASHIVFDYSREPDPRRQEYVIGVSDIVRINVWHMPDVSVDAKVRPDGTLTMPLLGGIVALGKTPSALQAEIETQLKSYIKDDSLRVSVAVTEVNSYHFTMAGNVERQGLYNSQRFLTVTEAVALAGGPNRFASLSKVVVIRPSPGGPRRIPIDLGAIYDGKRPEMNIVILSGDTIYIP
jgi:polysaccharide export outer membrane protein